MSKDPNINAELGFRVRELRKENHMTREKLSEKINVSTRFLADVESGKVGVSLATLKNISKTFGISADYLLGITPSSENSAYNQIINRIAQIDPQYYNLLKDIINSYYETVETATTQKSTDRNR